MSATRLVALLRAVNVGGRGALPMAELREITTQLGHRDVTTYIQSGNVVFTTERSAKTIAERQELADELSSAIDEQRGLKTPVLIRTADELCQAAAAVPYVDDEPNSSKLMVVFLTDPPTASAIATLDQERFAPDRFRVIGREMFVHFPNGAGHSKFTATYFEKKLSVAGTGRNLNTVRKLIEIACDQHR